VVSTEATTPDRDDRSAQLSVSPGRRITNRTWFATAVLLVAAFMELLDVTMANVAVPSIRQDLGASLGQAQWVVAGYALAFAVALMTGGRLGDIWGRRRTFLIGLAGFLLTSLLCGIAPSPAFLVASRVLQGLAAAVMLPQVLASISVWFPAEKRAAAFGLFGAVAGVGGLTAPLIGGSLINADLFSLGWRPIFLINLPIGLITGVAAIFLVDESRSPQTLRLDPLGVIIGALGVFLVVFPFIQGRDAGWPLWIWILLCLAVPVFALFVAVERRKARRDGSPLVDLALFRRRAFVAGLLVTLVFFAGVTAVAFVLMIFLQSGFGYTPLRAGFSLVPLAFGVVVGSGMSIGLSRRIGRTTLQIGCLVSMAGAIWLSLVIGHEAEALRIWGIVPPLGVFGLGIGLVVAPLADIVLAAAPRESTGSASGLQATMIQTGSAVGVAVLGAIFFQELVGLGHGFTMSMQRTLYQVAAIFAITALLVFGMPRRSLEEAPISVGH
jgi:EmrB/QacA subfamily drug resistance transporter